MFLVFGPEILTHQRNYHINLADCQGSFVENGTFFHNDILPDVVTWNKWNDEHNIPMNEVVFHDKINVKLVLSIWASDEDVLSKCKALLPSNVARLCSLEKTPTKPLRTPKSRFKYYDTESEPIRAYRVFLNFGKINSKEYVSQTRGKRFFTSIGYLRKIALIGGVAKETVANATVDKLAKIIGSNSFLWRQFKSRMIM